MVVILTPIVLMVLGIPGVITTIIGRKKSKLQPLRGTTWSDPLGSPASEFIWVTGFLPSKNKKIPHPKTSSFMIMALIGSPDVSRS